MRVNISPLANTLTLCAEAENPRTPDMTGTSLSDERVNISPAIQSGEALLSEDHCGGTDVTLPNRTLSFASYPQTLLNIRLNQLGFELSRTQPETPGDGNCLIHSVLDGYNNHRGDDALFLPDEYQFFRNVYLLLIPCITLNLQVTYCDGTEEKIQV